MPGRNVMLVLAAVVVVAVAASVFGPPAVAQFGGGGLGADAGDGGFIGGFGGALAGETLIQSGGSAVSGGGTTAPTQFILVSPDNMRAWGYSVEQGEWKPAPIEGEAGKKLVPIVTTTVATITEGRKIHAFSSLKGQWDTLDLPEDLDQLQPVVGQDYAQVRTATAVSVFSARTGKWATVKFAEE